MVIKGKLLNKDGGVSNVSGAKPLHGERSVRVQDFKKVHGLVTMKDIRELPVDSFELLRRKVKLMDEYAVANQKLVDLLGAVNGRVVNSINLMVDLQARLLVFEEDFKSRQELAKERIREIEEELEVCSEPDVAVRLKKELFKLKDFVLMNVMDSPTWQKIRQQVGAETQFIHKHGLDAADVQSKIEVRKRARNEDDLFEVVEEAE